MSRAVVYETFGGPEVPELREVQEPLPGPDELSVRVAVAGLNPMDWGISARPEVAARFGIAVPSGFGSGFGGALGRAMADFVVVRPPGDRLWRTPEGISDEVASTLPVAGLTAAAALAEIDVRPDDTVLISDAAGGVGVIAVQLAKAAGATVIGTASEGTFEFLRRFGVEPVAHGTGLEDRVRTLAAGGVTAATDLFGTETAVTALSLGVPPDRISVIAAAEPPAGVRRTGALRRARMPWGRSPLRFLLAGSPCRSPRRSRSSGSAMPSRCRRPDAMSTANS